MRPLAAAALVALLAGCTAEDASPALGWYLQASFEPGYARSDVDEACRVLACRNVTAGDPPRVGAWFATEEDCARARDRVLAVPHATAEACAKGGAGTRWTLRGRFLPGYTEDDVRRACLAGTGNASCVLLTSEPPQFIFGYVGEAPCRDARAALARVPHVETDACFEEPPRAG